MSFVFKAVLYIGVLNKFPSSVVLPDAVASYLKRKCMYRKITCIFAVYCMKCVQICGILLLTRALLIKQCVEGELL